MTKVYDAINVAFEMNKARSMMTPGARTRKDADENPNARVAV